MLSIYVLSTNTSQYASLPPPTGVGTSCVLVWIPLASELATVRDFLVCTISFEPVVGFLPNLHGYTGIYWDITKNLLDFGDHDIIFKVTAVEKLKIQASASA